MKALRTIVLFTIALTFSFYDSMAQCAMCRVTIENNVSNGDPGIAAGLNTGILYLFAMPYLLIAAIGILWYRHAKRKKQLRVGSLS